MATKLNIQSFTQASLVAKLFVIESNYSRVKDELLNDRQKFDDHVSNAVYDNFDFPEDQKRGLSAHLSLFLLGNNDNNFYKAIN